MNGPDDIEVFPGSDDDPGDSKEGDQKKVISMSDLLTASPDILDTTPDAADASSPPNGWKPVYLHSESESTSSFYTTLTHPVGSSQAVRSDGGSKASGASILSGTSWSSGIQGPGYLSGKAIKWIGAQALRAAIPVEVLIRYYSVSSTVQRAVSISRKKLKAVTSASGVNPKYPYSWIYRYQEESVEPVVYVLDVLRSARMATRRNIWMLTSTPEVNASIQRRTADVEAILHREFADVSWTLCFQGLVSGQRAQTEGGDVNDVRDGIPDSMYPYAKTWSERLATIGNTILPAADCSSDMLVEVGHLYTSLIRRLREYSKNTSITRDILRSLVREMFSLFASLAPDTHETNISITRHQRYWERHLLQLPGGQQAASSALRGLLDLLLEAISTTHLLRDDDSPLGGAPSTDSNLLLLFISVVHAQLAHPLYIQLRLLDDTSDVD